MVKVRASSGVIECFRFPLDPPVPHVHVPRSSHPIPSILDDNPESDPLPSFAFAPDHHEDLGIVLEAVSPRRHRSNSAYGPLHHQLPPNITRLESPYRVRALANPCLRSEILFQCVGNRSSRRPFHTIGVCTRYGPRAESRRREEVACGGWNAYCYSFESA